MKYDSQHKLSKLHYILATSLPIILIIILTSSIAQNYQKSISLAQQEILGTHTIQSLFKLSGFIQKIRGLNHISLRNNDNGHSKAIQENRKNAELIIDAILNDKSNNLNDRQHEKLLHIKKEFEQLVNVKDVRNQFQNQFNKYSHIIDDNFILMRDIAVHSNLVLDEDVEAYHLGIMMVERLPKFAEEIGKARGLVSAIPIDKTLSAVDVERINNRIDAILLEINKLEQDQQTIFRNTASTKSNLHYNLTNLKYSAMTYGRLLLTRKENNFSIKSPKYIFDHGTEVINTTERLHSSIGSYMRVLLNQRISDNKQYFILSITAALLAIVIIFFFGIFVYRINNKNINWINESRTMLETILNTIPVGVYWKDLKGKYLGANKIYLQNIGNDDFEYLRDEDDEALNFTQGKVPSSMYDDEIIKTSKAKLHSKVVMAWQHGPELIDISRVPLLNQDNSVFGLLGVYQDITDVQHQHDEIVEREEHYRHLIESSSAIPWEYNINTQRFTYVGPQAKDMLGYPVEDWYQRNFWPSQMHPDDRQKTVDYCMQQTEKNQDHEIEYRMCTKDGEYIWLKDYIKVPSGSDNKNLLRGFMFDISSKKKSDVSLRLLATAFDSQQPILITDKDTTILRVNKAFTKSTGFEEHEIIGKTPQFLSSGYHDNNFYSELWSSLETTGHWEGEIWNRRKNGEAYPLWQGITAVTDNEGLVTHYVASFFDLSDRYETQAREKLILESTSEAIYGLNNNGLCSFANPACINILGYDSEQDLIGKNMHELIHYSHAEGTFCPIEENSSKNNRLNGEGFHYYSEIFWRKDGTSFPVECWSQPIQRADKVLGSVVSFLDITERKLEEQHLLSSKNESDKANLAKSEFLARMSHELRTPLNAILGFTQLLDIDKTLSVTSKEFSNEIHKAGHHLLSLINDILDLAKIEAGRINIELKTASLKDIINECANLIIPLAQQSNSDFIYDTDAIQDISIETDPTRLTEVLLNLLSNAVKYNSENGTITFEAKLLNNNRLRISVTDTGDGLSKSQQQMLFKPFERLGAECTKIEGTGIGLVISKHIIEILDGNIGVDSKIGEGSTFWVELDYIDVTDKKDIESISATKSNVIDFTGIKNKTYDILYVEDNLSNVRLMEYVLNEYSFIKLRVALTAEAALDMIKDNEPDLMIFDINLPGMNGFQLLEKTRTIKKYEGTPIFAMSANAMARDIELALSQGFTQYMTKPIDVPHFLRNLFEHLGVDNKQQSREID